MKIMKFFTVVIIAILMITFVGCNNSNNEEKKSNYLYNDFNLPNAAQVDVHTNPIMYDFMNGCIGWHTPEIFNFNKDMIDIVCTKDGSSIIYGQINMPVQGERFGIHSIQFGNYPYKINIDSEEQKDRFYEAMESQAEKYAEEGYTFYVIRNPRSNKYGEIDFGQVSYGEKSYWQKWVKQGGGYPTELLRLYFADVLKYVRVNFFGVLGILLPRQKIFFMPRREPAFIYRTIVALER